MLTQEVLKELIYYNPDTGKFRWKVYRNYNAKKGQIAGYQRNGYIIIGINGTLYLAHRLAFLYMTGEWPNDQVDHINNKGIDNHWNNLRNATNRENSCNQTNPKSNNESGYLGVCFIKDGKRNKRWRAKFGNIFIGYYSTAKEAADAYLKEKSK